MKNKNGLLFPYYSKPSDDINIFNCSFVKAYCFTDSIEAVGVSYRNHHKTIREMEAEKNYILKNIDNLDIEIKAGVTAKERLKQLDVAIAERRKKYAGRRKPKNRCKLKSDNLKNAYISQRKMVRLTKNNFSYPVFALCATLTYRDKQYELKVVYKDFGKLRDKLKYRFEKIGYIAIYEPHDDGSWHIHLIYKNAKGLTKDSLEKMWGKGFVYIEKFDASAAPYFCSKNDRLKYFPSGSRLYSASRNIKEPTARMFTPAVFQDYVETKEMQCTSIQAKTLYKLEADGPKKVNHFVYMNFQK